MSSGRIGSVALWVSDLELSASFYRDVVGLPLTFSDPHEPENVPHYETMWNGDGRLLDELDWSKEGPSEPALWFNIYQATDTVTTGFQFGVPVDDVRAVCDRARRAGTAVVTPVSDSPFGGVRAVLSDPDGNRVEVESHA